MRTDTHTVSLGNIPQHDASERGKRLSHLDRDGGQCVDIFVPTSGGSTGGWRSYVDLHICVRACLTRPVVPSGVGQLHRRAPTCALHTKFRSPNPLDRISMRKNGGDTEEATYLG